MTPMSHVRRFDHVGITVADLDTVTAFFVGLGLEVEGRTFVEGEFLDTVSGIPDSRTEIVMLRPPDGGTRLELSSFVRPDHEPGSPAAMANELGLRNVAFEVDDLQAAVDRLATDGYGLVGGIGEYEHVWRMAYVRGPEGIIVSLAERIGCRRRRRSRPCALVKLGGHVECRGRPRATPAQSCVPLIDRPLGLQASLGSAPGGVSAAPRVTECK